jgi:penicillin-binding protein 1A
MLLGVWGFIALTAILGYCALDLPSIETATQKSKTAAISVVASNGNTIKSYGKMFSEYVPANELPIYLLDALTSTEDRRFYTHFGFDVIGFSRAMFVNIKAMKFKQGGSTITQQVAKNLFLSRKKTIKRKVQELLLSFWLEYNLTKQQILSLYFNRVYFGAGTYGVDAAAHKYFHTSSRDLTLYQSAILVGLLKAPSLYNPLYHKDRAHEKAVIVLKNMLKDLKITQEEYENALSESYVQPKLYRVKGARFFTDWTLEKVNYYLGTPENNINVFTTLDERTQEIAERALQNVLNSKGIKENDVEGAVVVMDMNGAVKAMVGGGNYSKSQYNRATQSLRQPGSAFKPFVYLTALEAGMKPNDIVLDEAIDIDGWRPQNSDKKYHGEVSLTHALAHSYNTIAAKIAYQVGIKKVVKMAKRLGITANLKTLPSISLGTSGVTLLDMVTAYTSIANGGYAVWPHSIETILDKNGYSIYSFDGKPKVRVLDENIASMMKSMMISVVESGTGKRASFGVLAGGKTGTSQFNRDGWFIGFTNKYVCGVWLGKDNNQSVRFLYGGGAPARTWKEIMRQIH